MDSTKSLSEKSFGDKANHIQHDVAAPTHTQSVSKKPKRTKTLSLNPAECEALENLIEDVIIDGMDEGVVDTEEETSDEDEEAEKLIANINLVNQREGLESDKSVEATGSESDGKVYPPQLKVAVKHMKNLPPRFLKKIQSTKDDEIVVETKLDDTKAIAINDRIERTKAARSKELIKKEQKLKIRGLLEEYEDEIGSPEQPRFLQTITEGQALSAKGVSIIADVPIVNSAPSPNRTSSQYSVPSTQAFSPYTLPPGQTLVTPAFSSVTFIAPNVEPIQSHLNSSPHSLHNTTKPISCQELEAELMGVAINMQHATRLPETQSSRYGEPSTNNSEMSLINGMLPPNGIITDTVSSDWRSQISAEAPEFVPRSYTSSMNPVQNISYLPLNDQLLSTPANFSPHSVGMPPMIRPVTVPDSLSQHALQTVSTVPQSVITMQQPPPPFLNVPQQGSIGRSSPHATPQNFLIPKIQTNVPPPPLPSSITSPNGISVIPYQPVQYAPFSYTYPGPVAPMRSTFYTGNVHVAVPPYSTDKPPMVNNKSSQSRTHMGYYRAEQKGNNNAIFRDHNNSSYRTPIVLPVRKPPEVNTIPIKIRLKTLLDAEQKVMVILRGCPGSGKSALAQEIVGDGVILSTDEYFVKDGVYMYEYHLLAEAHQWNQNRTVEALLAGKNPIIIDNTNLQAWEMKFYVSAALEHSYAIEIAEPETPWRYKARELAQRNTHGVTLETIHKMLDRFERNIAVESLLVCFEGRTTNAERKEVIEEDMKRQEEAWKKPVRRRRKRRRRRHRSGKAAITAAANAAITDSIVTTKDAGDEEGSSEENDEDSGPGEDLDKTEELEEKSRHQNGAELNWSEQICGNNWNGATEAESLLNDKKNTTNSNSFSLHDNKSESESLFLPESNNVYTGENLAMNYSYNEPSSNSFLGLTSKQYNEIDAQTESVMSSLSNAGIHCEPLCDKDILSPIENLNSDEFYIKETDVNKESSKIGEVISATSRKDAMTMVEQGDNEQNGQLIFRIVLTKARDITDGLALPQRSQRPPQRLCLDQSSWTSDELDVWSNDVSELATLEAMFPDLKREDLEDILLRCGYDVQWATDVLLDSGYEYNEPDKQEKLSEMQKKDSHNICEVKTLVNLCYQSINGRTHSVNNNKLESFILASCANRLKAIENFITARKQKTKSLSENLSSDYCDELNERTAWSIFLDQSENASQMNDYVYDYNLTLPESLAVKLVDMFGPIGFGLPPELLYAEDLVCGLSRDTLAAIHKDWSRTVEARLLAEEAFFSGSTAIDDVRSDDLDLQSSGLYQDSSIGCWKSSTDIKAAPPKLMEIMDEELAKEINRCEMAQCSSRANTDLATKLKYEKQLQSSFPAISSPAIRQSLASNGYSLERAMTSLQNISLTNEIKDNLNVRNASDTDEDIDSLRKKVSVLCQLRRECYGKARLAHGKQMNSVAAFYCQQGRNYSEQMQLLRKKTIDRLFTTRFAELEERDSVLDLHGMQVNEAVRVTLSALAVAANESTENRKRRHIVVITGHGSHSIGGIAKLRPAILLALKNSQYEFEELRPGVIKVRCTRR